jgi:hypothetical protein
VQTLFEYVLLLRRCGGGLAGIGAIGRGGSPVVCVPNMVVPVLVKQLIQLVVREHLWCGMRVLRVRPGRAASRTGLLRA